MNTGTAHPNHHDTLMCIKLEEYIFGPIKYFWVWFCLIGFLQLQFYCFSNLCLIQNLNCQIRKHWLIRLKGRSLCVRHLQKRLLKEIQAYWYQYQISVPIHKSSTLDRDISCIYIFMTSLLHLYLYCSKTTKSCSNNTSVWSKKTTFK